MSSSIIGVWNSNFLPALYDFDCALNVFHVVSVDTEFPGLLLPTSRYAPESVRYNNLKDSVDKTNLIQLGLTLSDHEGRVYRTWEFNFKFDLGTEIFNQDSIQFLEKNGLDFDLLMEHGIDIAAFSRIFSKIISRRKNLEWVSFHGIHDMCHLLKLITNIKLPITLVGFAKLAGSVFGSVVDIKYVATLCEDLHGGEIGLEKLAKKLGVTRYGGAHNAGSDSLLTTMVYTTMKSVYGLDEDNGYTSFLYGISLKIERRFRPNVYFPPLFNCAPPSVYESSDNCDPALLYASIVPFYKT